MKKTVTVLFILLSFAANAQQFGLYNSRTLFDAFENPSQKAFYADSSKKFASNFLIPTLTFNSAFIGPAQASLKYGLYQSTYYGRDLALGEGKINTLISNSTTYLFTFRIFKSVKFNKELGFSWQVRNDVSMNITNETFALFDDYKLLNQSQYDGLFNDKGYLQSYHQFGLTYRENYNKKLSLGVKASVLSGILYSKLQINQSSLLINSATDSYNLKINGYLKANYNTEESESFSKKMLYPLFKHPGLAITTSASYKFKDGWFVLGNLKDIGFIHWNKSSYYYPLNANITIKNASSQNAGNRLADSISNIKIYSESKAFTSLINGKAEVLINKDLGSYQPNFLLSKNLFYPGADIALIHNYGIKNYVFTLSTAYNTQKYFQLGGQFMIKSPNFELFLGSDQILKTYYTTKATLTNNVNIGKGYTGGSVYLGFGLKIGPMMEHQANANRIPGMVNTVSTESSSFFNKIFGKKAKKK